MRGRFGHSEVKIAPKKSSISEFRNIEFEITHSIFKKSEKLILAAFKSIPIATLILPFHS